MGEILNLQKIIERNKMQLKELCMSLVKSDSEEEIVEILKKANYWDNPKVWENFGGNENNYSTIGNQQSLPETALVEKLINSVDAVLMSECLKTGCNPRVSQRVFCIFSALIYSHSIVLFL